MTQGTEPVIAPAGHLHGVVRGARTTINLRLGTRTVELDEVEYAAWLLAHGLADVGPHLLSAAALGTLVGDPSPLERLYDRGLLVEVPSDPARYRAFAEAYRLVPLVHGLGNSPDGSAWQFRIGLPGESGATAGLAGAWAELHTLGYEIWRWSAATRSLAEAGDLLVAAADSARSSNPAHEGLGGLDDRIARDHGIAIVAPLLTGWAAALQPASPTPLVPGPRGAGSPLPPPEPVDPFTALDPEEMLSVPWEPGRPDSPVARIPRWEAEPGHPGAAGWLFAVGHDGGSFYHPADSSFVSRTVRVGADDHQLDDGEGRIWELTRRAATDRLWTRTSIAATAVGEGVPDAGRRLDGLIERGLIVEVHPGTDRAVAFARAYRLHPLLHGLGNPEDDPAMFEYGVPGRFRVGATTGRTALLWRTAGQWPTLWDAITAVSGNDTEHYLTYWGLHGVRDLLCDGLAYLDLAP
ncbi:hypothetical protein [Cryptosporangium minutisporangium]|uniref:Uncharacterized protein n=1 Tax=Cryptosporangium minutisporangium TaxID=113569 RepID=A0ABP6SYZ3_9ACTN